MWSEHVVEMKQTEFSDRIYSAEKKEKEEWIMICNIFGGRKVE